MSPVSTPFNMVMKVAQSSLTSDTKSSNFKNTEYGVRLDSTSLMAADDADSNVDFHSNTQIRCISNSLAANLRTLAMISASQTFAKHLKLPLH